MGCHVDAGVPPFSDSFGGRLVKPSYPSSTRVVPSQQRLLKAVFVCALISVLIVLLALGPVPQRKLSASDAKDHIGETATVCGTVASTRYAPSSKGQPTFLNLDEPYPRQIFTILIWGSNRSKFGAPDVDYRNKQVCATGKITEYRGTPEIVADDPGQIKIASGK